MKLNPVIFIVIGVALLGGTFYLFKSKQQAKTSESNNQPFQSVNQTSSETSELLAIAKTFELVIENKKIISGPEIISVVQGDEVVIKITSDEAEEFHIHGYDQNVGLKPNMQATLEFTASTSGRFEYELEVSKTDIGILEVQPK